MNERIMDTRPPCHCGERSFGALRRLGVLVWYCAEHLDEVLGLAPQQYAAPASV